MNVVICGRPNVGKSSIFNRLLGRKRALVLDTPGVTRDRIVEPADFWVRAKRYPVNLIDTGGMGPGQFEKEIKMQVETALTEADVILFVIDIRAGLTPADREVFSGLRHSGLLEKTPVLGVLNKADHENLEEDVSQFYELPLDALMPVSAEHAIGFDDLKEWIVDHAGIEPEVELTPEMIEEREKNPEPETPRVPRIAIVGQPNVGKSTMLNAICGEKRTIVSPIAGTTVDAIDLNITWKGRDFVMVDTAGIRRKNKTEQGVEVLSVVQSRKMLEGADLAILVMDGEKGVYDQDEKIAGLIEEYGCSVVMVLNKWDLQEDNDDFSQKLAEEELRKKIRFLGWAPLVFTTAIDGRGLDRLFRMVAAVLDGRKTKLNTKELTEFVRLESEVHNPHNAKFYFVHQSGKNPPTFVAHVNDPKKVDFSLSRHLIKALRQRWGFEGTPIRFHFLKTKNTGE